MRSFLSWMSSSLSVSSGIRRLVESDSSVAVLFVGDEGGSQSSAAEALAAAWHCLEPVDGAGCGACRACGAFERGVTADFFRVEPGGPQDLIRLRQVTDDPVNPEANIKGFLGSPPAIGRNRVVWIDRADRLSHDSANALLKTIEEPPRAARFVLSSGASGRILPTIRSRCLLIPCDASEPPGGFASVAAGGSQASLDVLESSGLVADFEAFADRCAAASRTEGLSLSDQFQELMARYVDVRGREDRLSRGEFVRMFANVAGSRAAGSPRWRLLVDRALTVHRAILGNVNAPYLADWLFAAP